MEDHIKPNIVGEDTVTWGRVSQILISLAVLVFVSFIAQKNRTLAGLASALPLTVPLAIWIVFRTTGGDYRQTAEFMGSQLRAVMGVVSFVIICYVTISHRWPLPLAIASGYAGWLGVVLAAPWAARLATWSVHLIQG
jgi:hypothetical protein